MRSFSAYSRVFAVSAAAAFCLLSLRADTTKPSARPTPTSQMTRLDDGASLKGWHVSAKTGHSGASKNKSGGKWEVVDGAITTRATTPAVLSGRVGGGGRRSADAMLPGQEGSSVWL